MISGSFAKNDQQLKLHPVGLGHPVAIGLNDMVIDVKFWFAQLVEIDTKFFYPIDKKVEESARYLGCLSDWLT